MSLTISNILGLSSDLFFIAEFIAGVLLIFLMSEMLFLIGYILKPRRFRI